MPRPKALPRRVLLWRRAARGEVVHAIAVHPAHGSGDLLGLDAVCGARPGPHGRDRWRGAPAPQRRCRRCADLVAPAPGGDLGDLELVP